MGRSLGMTAYRAYAKRSASRTFTPHGDRRKGSLLWIHAAEPDSLMAIQDLAQWLCAARHGLSVLITLPENTDFEAVQSNWVPHPDILLELVPPEHPDAVKAFWRHWSPDMLVWTWGALRPILIQQAHEKKCPVALVNADTDGFQASFDRWLPELSRQLLTPCVAVMARSVQGKRKLESLGLRSSDIILTAPLEAGGQALPCDDRELSHWSQIIGGRSVWLAGNVQAEEFDTVLAAHRYALRLSHRLLLILNPANGELTEDFRKGLAEAGFRFADRTEDEEPDDATQVVLAPDHQELGLFYRLAPVTFMGSSLVSGYNGRNPFEAAALGSAVLYGPNVSRFMPFYSRLAKAGAARI
ncbi:MAG: glycosyltransferase N-terminal domain-containing protein, partial [Roseobacter sp.]|nr:glycosyltransferase N-terminal domain-containing protein [Roseobacter sp.]